MARRGDAIKKRGPSWFLDCEIRGVHYHRKLGKGITRSVAVELAQVERAAILKGGSRNWEETEGPFVR